MRIDNLLVQNSARISVAQTNGVPSSIGVNTGNKIATEDFAKILDRQLGENQSITFSKHAQLRMAQREMSLSEADLQKLGDAVQKAGEKGVVDTLVLMKEMAFIVNVPSKVVVTAMKDQDLCGNVFTNIDGAVIV